MQPHRPASPDDLAAALADSAPPPSKRSNGPGRGWLGLVLVSAATGAAVAAYLTGLHLDLFYGAGVADSLCDIGDTFRCSTVNGAPESELWGVPQSVLAFPVYGASAALGLLAYRKADRRYALALFALGLLSVGYSAYLAYISAAVIKAWCLFCIILYVIHAALLALGAAASGVRPARWLPAAAALPIRAPGVVGAGAVAGLFSFALAFGVYEQRRGVAAEAAAAREVAAARAAPAEEPAGVFRVKDVLPADRKQVRLGMAKEGVRAPAGAPSIGPADAPVTIIEWSDFQCPFCRRLATTLHQVVEEHPEDVRLVYAYFPLDLACNQGGIHKSMHPSACDAAAAAQCAHAQGRFWEMHDRLFDDQAGLGQKNWLRFSRELGLDQPAFEACMASPETKAVIGEHSALGGSLGVSGTPMFFVNGRVLSGGQPIEVLRAVIDAELAGQKEALDLDVRLGVEAKGAVTGAPTSVAVPGLDGVTIDTFEASVVGGRAESAPGVAPARGLSWTAARDACAAAGKRLCTDQEWSAACSGVLSPDTDLDERIADEELQGKRYGYGDHRRVGLCADARNPTAVGELLTGDHPGCKSPAGAYDLTGGVKEWVGLSPRTAALKGGSYASGDSARCGYFRDDVAIDTEDPSNGLRCCAGPLPSLPATVKGREVGERLGDFSVEALEGGSVRADSLRGRPAVLTFWASWCGPCQKEMPALALLATKYADQGLKVLGVSVDSEPAKLGAWLAAHPMPFPIARDPTSALFNEFPNKGLPTTLWIQRDGTIRLRTTGVPPSGDKRLDELVTELLAR